MNTPVGGLAWPHDDAAVAVLESVAARLRSDPDAMVEAAMGTVATSTETVRRETRLLAGQLTDLVRHRRRLTPGEVERIEALGAVRAACGLSLDELQRASRTALTAAWRHLVGLVPSGPDSVPAVTAVARLAEEVFDFVQQSSEAMVRGHEAHHRLGALRRHAAEDGHEHLFDGVGELARGAVEAGLDLLVPHGVVLFAGASDGSAEPPQLRDVLADFGGRVPSAVVRAVRRAPVPHALAVVPSSASDAWCTTMAMADSVAREGGLVVLAAGPARGAGSLYGSYTDLAVLLPVVRRVGALATGRRPDDLGIYRFLASVGRDEAEAFVQRVLGPVLDLPQPERGDALRHLATLPSDGSDDGLARIRLDTALALLRRYPDLDGD